MSWLKHFKHSLKLRNVFFLLNICDSTERLWGGFRYWEGPWKSNMRSQMTHQCTAALEMQEEGRKAIAATFKQNANDSTCTTISCPPGAGRTRPHHRGQWACLRKILVLHFTPVHLPYASVHHVGACSAQMWPESRATARSDASSITSTHTQRHARPTSMWVWAQSQSRLIH